MQDLSTGIFNIVEDNGFVSIEKARRELGWDPGFRIATEKQQKTSKGKINRCERIAVKLGSGH